MSQARWCVEDDTGQAVAQGSAPTKDEAISEVMRYAMQYAQDGYVRFWVKQGRKTELQGSLGLANFTMKLSGHKPTE